MAALLAIVGSLLFFFPIPGDRIGSFFSLPIPPVINTLEYIFTAVLLVTLFMASKVCSRRRTGESQNDASPWAETTWTCGGSRIARFSCE